jgi:Transposase DDE domain
MRQRSISAATRAQASANNGYCSEANLDGYVATGRARDAASSDDHPPAPPDAGLSSSPQAQPAPSAAEAISPATPAPSAVKTTSPAEPDAKPKVSRVGGHSSPYRLRKQLREPVFGQVKQARSFRQFLMRGFENGENVCGEWAMICTTHNLLKLFHRWSVPPAAA